MIRNTAFGAAVACTMWVAAASAAAASQLTVLYSFKGGRDGANPQAGLIMDRNGVLYGTTAAGGHSAPCKPTGCGTVFALAPPVTGDTNWVETVLHRFRGPAAGGGANPVAGLVARPRGAGRACCQTGAGRCGCVRTMGP